MDPANQSNRINEDKMILFVLVMRKYSRGGGGASPRSVWKLSLCIKALSEVKLA